MANSILTKSSILDISNAFRTFAYCRKQRLSDPYFFDPCGLVLFTGFQGSGKTLSAVRYVIELANKYPCSILYTNVDIDKSLLPEDYDVRQFTGQSDLHVQNGTKGIIYLIDEIQLYFGANPESKYHVNQDVLMEFCQQRKQRKHVVGTSQVYGRLVKSLREQVADVIMCRSVGYLQLNTLIDGRTADEVNGKLVYQKDKQIVFWHSPELYQAYDTYAKITEEDFN